MENIIGGIQSHATEHEYTILLDLPFYRHIVLVVSEH